LICPSGDDGGDYKSKRKDDVLACDEATIPALVRDRLERAGYADGGEDEARRTKEESQRAGKQRLHVGWTLKLSLDPRSCHCPTAPAPLLLRRTAAVALLVTVGEIPKWTECQLTDYEFSGDTRPDR
jgi:hypothetical protein